MPLNETPETAGMLLGGPSNPKASWQVKMDPHSKRVTIPNIWTKPRIDRRRMERSTNTLPSLNAMEEYDADFEEYCHRAKAHHRKLVVPQEGDGITSDEWAQIVDSMTPEEWSIFVSTQESKETVSQPMFDFPATSWPSLASDNESGNSTGEKTTKESVFEVEEGVLGGIQEDGFVAIESNDAESQSWAMLSKRGEEDVDSVMSWNTVPLSFREVLLRSAGPMRDPDKKIAKRIVGKRTPSKDKENATNDDDILYKLHETAKTIRGGKPRFRVKSKKPSMGPPR